MKTHGNYAAYTTSLEKDIKFIKKRTLKWFKSSKKAKRGFCKKCGASMFFKFLEGGNCFGHGHRKHNNKQKKTAPLAWSRNKNRNL